MLHTVSVIPYVSGNGAGVHVLEVICQVSGASALAHTCDQVPGEWVDYVHPLKFPSNTYTNVFPGEDGVPGKISAEIDVLLSARI